MYGFGITSALPPFRHKNKQIVNSTTCPEYDDCCCKFTKSVVY